MLTLNRPALIEGGVDLIMIETIFDTLNAKSAVFAAETIFDEVGKQLPLMISGTMTDASGRPLSGQTTEAFYNSLRYCQPLSVGLNCALGPDELRQYVEELSKISRPMFLRIRMLAFRMHLENMSWPRGDGPTDR
ncbi:MAG: hypothetical protein CENE_00845 [Candidatus Celerinatantimonas neptuna]|nr:MAG: hypothetical protein CENE_00845 [Candidatus Celerinatantimonas neptuna]